MRLLTFAHRGEAKHFISEEDFQPLPFAFDGLYKSPDTYLLITGEGLKNASEKAAAVCGAFSNDISHIINLGLAGALTPKVELGEIYEVRTCYGEGEFKSYSCQSDDNKKIDCISSKERAFSDQQAEKLSHFASLVDREAWAIGSICELFRIPYRSIKLISDRVGENKEICQAVKELAPEYSARLYQYDLENLRGEKIIHYGESLLEADQRFYLTTSQRRKYDSLLSALKLKNSCDESEVLGSLELNQICEEITRPKLRTNALLEKMHDQLNPFEASLRMKVQEVLSDYQSQNVQIKIDPSFESEAFSLTASIKDQEHLNEVLQRLSQFPYPKIQELLRGKL